ncbi:MAG: Exodeoxyribonuclease, partial [Rhodospirillales bacterium]|nr:Exodeoxyribonuclease [Rhodospirillales bacterium]
MKIASFNVNSVRRRVPHIVGFLQRAEPDMVFLQELKCQTA